MACARMSAQIQANAWNAKHQIFAEVIVTRDDGTELRTRTLSQAYALNEKHVIIFVQSGAGSVPLDRVRPADPIPIPIPETQAT